MAAPKHILVMNVFFAPQSYGGATIVAEAVARELRLQHGCRVSVISSMDRPDLVPYSVMRTEAGGIQNYAIVMPRGRSYADSYNNPNVTEIVSGLLDDLEPDLLHIHCMQDLGIGPIALAKTRGLPVVLSVHDFWWLCEYQFMIRPNGQYCGQNPIRIENCRGCADRMGRARTRFALLQEAVAQVDLITYPSQFARDLSVASGFPDARSVVWENGVRQPDAAFFTAQTARRTRDPRLVFGFLGGPSQIKGWPLIKSAFEGLTQDNFAGFLVDASLDQTWWANTDITKMEGDWQVHPRFEQKDIDAFYAKIDVLLFPSQWKETFGLTIREAVARGLRVIQTDSGGTAEWAGADRGDMLQIGDGPDRLRAKVRQVLDTAEAHPDPRPVADYGDQARAFMALISSL
jgi:glycosyltransferase involved in cell wall biosynthesis